MKRHRKARAASFQFLIQYSCDDVMVCIPGWRDPADHEGRRRRGSLRRSMMWIPVIAVIQYPSPHKRRNKTSSPSFSGRLCSWPVTFWRREEASGADSSFPAASNTSCSMPHFRRGARLLRCASPSACSSASTGGNRCWLDPFRAGLRPRHPRSRSSLHGQRTTREGNRRRIGRISHGIQHASGQRHRIPAHDSLIHRARDLP